MAKKINIKRPNPGPAELPKFAKAVRRPIVGGPAEIPLPYVAAKTVNVLVGELHAMRARLNNIETQMLQMSLGPAHVVVGGPNELPAPEIDSGGGVFTFPRPGPNPAELPIEFSREVTALHTEISALGARLSKSIAGLRQSIGAGQPG